MGLDNIEATFEIDHSPWISPFAARSVAIKIYSSHNLDPITNQGLVSEKAYLHKGEVVQKETVPIIGKMKMSTRIIKFKLKFEVVQEFGAPGAFAIENGDKHEFFLKSATFHYKDHPIPFHCNSWVYPIHKTRAKRLFFLNELYLPKDTPPGLVELRAKELRKLRGGGLRHDEMRKPWDRIYDYDFYNDLGDPDNGREYVRPCLGGSPQYPYPRRLRTGRPPCHSDKSAESRPAGCFETYVPPDERMCPKKEEELRKNFENALVRFLAPKSDQPSPWSIECPPFIEKILRCFVPKEACTAKDLRVMMQSIEDLVRRKPAANHRRDTRSGFDSIDDIFDIFSDKQVDEMDERVVEKLKKLVPTDILNQVVATASKRIYSANTQLPSIIAGEYRHAWLEKEEFGRQMLAGANPVRIRLLEEFSPRTDWPPYMQEYLDEVIKEKKAFILEHDYYVPYLKMINGKGAVCAHATRTVLKWSNWYDTIEPIAIELLLPADDDDNNSNMNTVVFPEDGLRWILARFHVAANDAVHHQLVSHWLHTHAIMEPFIIATRRQLSVMHPIHRLLDPHFKDTLHINALARAIFLNAGGILERTLFTGEYSMRLSSHFYKEWRFDEQALPKDLEKRGMASKAEESADDKAAKEEREKSDGKDVGEKAEAKGTDNRDVVERKEGVQQVTDEGLNQEIAEAKGTDNRDVVEREEGVKQATDDKTANKKERNPAGLKLTLEDYPYAKDGIEIWDAIETWVGAYCKIFYGTDDSVKQDMEIQGWWLEIRNKGHGDQDKGWYDLTSLENIVRALTTLIWTASGLHAALNFGQYAYAGWPLNRPMLLRKFVPKECDGLESDDEKFVVEMLPEKFEMEFVIAVLDILSRHTSDEVFLGQRPPLHQWTENKQVDKEFQEFRKTLKQIEKNIKERNRQYPLMNRWGHAKIPYKLLYPDTSKAPSKEVRQEENITGKGIPNSISI